MAQPRINPEKITSPIQLLAIWFVALVSLTGAFIGGAHLVTQPWWVPGLLVIAAIGNVPLFIGFMFRLQTRFRPEMLEDKYYLEHRKNAMIAREAAEQLSLMLRATGIDPQSLARGTVLVSGDLSKEIGAAVDKLDRTAKSDEEQGLDTVRDWSAESLYAYAEGLALQERWLKAAQILERYAAMRPLDWEGHHFRAVCYANVRGGQGTNLAALRACSDAIDNIPVDLTSNVKARLYGYRERS